MHQIIYISTARAGMSEQDVEAILAISRLNNGRDGITGLLISDGKRFLQALEGEQTAVEAAYVRIRADPRHRAAVLLSTKTVGERQFGTWDMAFGGFGRAPEQAELSGTVDRLVATVPDLNTRALFAGFVRIERPTAA